MILLQTVPLFIVGRGPDAEADAPFLLVHLDDLKLILRVDGKRANLIETPPDAPTVRLTMDVETFTRLGCGRWDPAETLQAGKIQIRGDQALGETIIREINFMV